MNYKTNNIYEKKHIKYIGIYKEDEKENIIYVGITESIIYVSKSFHYLLFKTFKKIDDDKGMDFNIDYIFNLFNEFENRNIKLKIYKYTNTFTNRQLLISF